MWRRRRVGRWAGWGAGLALALAGLALVGGGVWEELLAEALAAWGGDDDWGGGEVEEGGVGWGEFANGGGVTGLADWGGWGAVKRGGVGSGGGAADRGSPADQANRGGVAKAGGAGADASTARDDVSAAANDAWPPGAPSLLPPPPPCGPTPPFLLVLVPSAPSHAARRQAVRDTWGGGARTAPGGLPTRTIFVLGVPGAPAEQAALGAEARRHGDLLQGPFPDTYPGLGRKTLLLLRWAAARCPRAPFLLKADDDVFVNLPALTSYLAGGRHPRRLYLGRLHWGVRPERDPGGRHHVPAALYPAAAFPPYCSGTAYVLSRQAVTAVLAAAPHVPMVAPEDVWVGLCARRAGVAPRHSARMGGSARVPPDGCCYGEVMFSSHRLGPGELRGVWGLLRGGGGGCSRLQRALGVLRCRLLAAGEWLWG